jgi:hypothetical protein
VFISNQDLSDCQQQARQYDPPAQGQGVRYRSNSFSDPGSYI